MNNPRDVEDKTPGIEDARAETLAESAAEVEQQSHGRFKVRLIAAGVLLGLSAVGMVVTDVKPSYAWYYWMAMVPVFGIACVAVAWRTTPDQAKLTWAAVRFQAYHWGGLLVAMQISFAYTSIGSVNQQSAGLVALLLLALATYLAGVHLDGAFMLVGALLGAFSVVGAYAQDHLLLWTFLLCLLALAVVFLRYKFARHPNTS